MLSWISYGVGNWATVAGKGGEKKGVKNTGTVVVEKGGERGSDNYSLFSATEIEKKIEESKKELEKWEEIRQLKDIQDKIDVKMSEESGEEEWQCVPKSTYRQIVISGGAGGGLTIYGAVKTAYQKGLWNYDDVKTLWGTSAGSIVAISIALKYDWNTLDDYLIKRPWNTVFKLNLMRLWNEKGLMGKEVIEETMIPLLAGKGLKPEITMGELFMETGVDVHIFLTELLYSNNEFHTIDVSHKTHPEWRVIDAVYASSCLPLLFVPYEVSEPNECGVESSMEEVRRVYLDGAVMANFPFNHCVSYDGVDESEVLGFYLNKGEDVPENPQKEKRDLVSFVKRIASAVFNHTDKTFKTPPKTEKACLITLQMNILDRFDLSLVRSSEKRREYIEIGSRMCIENLLEKKLLVRRNPLECLVEEEAIGVNITMEDVQAQEEEQEEEQENVCEPENLISEL